MPLWHFPPMRMQMSLLRNGAVVHYTTEAGLPPPSPETSLNLPPPSPLQMSVDLERRHDLPINIDIRFPAVPCAVLR